MRRADDIENRVERNAFEVGSDLAVHRDGNERGVNKHVAGAARFLGVRSADGRRNLGGDDSRAGQPGRERDGAFDLAALAHASDDLRNQQLSAIGIDARIEVDACGVHARAEV